MTFLDNRKEGLLKNVQERVKLINDKIKNVWQDIPVLIYLFLDLS